MSIVLLIAIAALWISIFTCIMVARHLSQSMDADRELCEILTTAIDDARDLNNDLKDFAGDFNVNHNDGWARLFDPDYNDNETENTENEDKKEDTIDGGVD